MAKKQSDLMRASNKLGDYPPRTIPKIDYIYIERWPNNRVYVGWTVHPERRHRQHIGELARGAEDVRYEIKRQGGILPEMTVIAIFDIYDPRINYEERMMQTAHDAGFSVINKDFHENWTLDQEDEDDD
jgi:hypothetical protein